MIEAVNSEREIKIKYKEQTNIRRISQIFLAHYQEYSLISKYLTMVICYNVSRIIPNYSRTISFWNLELEYEEQLLSLKIWPYLLFIRVELSCYPTVLRSVYNAQLYSAEKVFSRTKKEKEEERTFFYYERGNGCTWNYSYQPVTLLVGIRSYTRSPIDHSYM